MGSSKTLCSFSRKNSGACLARLVEYLWRYRHQSNLQEGFNQALRSVSFDPSESRTSDHQHGRVQLETQQGDWTVVSQVERTSDGLYQPPAFVRLDNEEFTEGKCRRISSILILFRFRC